MNHSAIPVTECWRESYEKLTIVAELNRLPTAAFLKACPDKSQEFCHWIWRMLGKQGGRICDADEQTCSDCQKDGLPKWAAVYVLSNIIRDEDPLLYIILREKLKQYQERPGPGGSDDLPPTDPLDPQGPLAARMTVPQKQLFTDAVARELRGKPWMKMYL